MKKLILVFALIVTGFVQSSYAQGTTKQSLQMLITDYLNLKNALTKDNGYTANAAGKTLTSDFENVSLETFSSDQNKTWLQYSDALIKNASNIASTTDISKQREQFKDLSSNFYDLLKELNINTTDLYYQYCPMTEAYWISEKSKIANPYFGKKMLTCGSTKESL